MNEYLDKKIKKVYNSKVLDIFSLGRYVTPTDPPTERN